MKYSTVQNYGGDILRIPHVLILILSNVELTFVREEPIRNRGLLSICTIVILITAIAATAAAQSLSPNLYSGLRWRMIGPFRGGRALAAAGVPGQPETFYFGSVAGGVWKSTNAGLTWNPIFDQQPIASIGALAIAPSDPNVIYVGTGEADMRSNITFGDGVYKSTDAGRTWKNVGLRDSRQIGRLLVDPRDPNVVLVAALGHAYGPNRQRGVFRTTDGGQTWTKVLYKDDHTGAIDLVFASGDSRIVYAALWSTQRPPWSVYPPETGEGSGIYKSSDGGVTWTQLTGHGLPAGKWGRIGLATASARGISRVYALIDEKENGGLFRSDDGGASWQRVGSDSRIRERSWYFSGITLDPANPDIVYIPNVAIYRSIDGGKTWAPFKGAPGGDDYHSLWIDPTDSRRMILASDQGSSVSVDGGRSWSSWYNQPTAQLYHVATDNQFPYYVYGAQQDSGTVAIASRSDYGSITYRDWYSVAGGESGYIAPEPSHPATVYTGDTYGRLDRFDKNTGQAQDISPLAVNPFGASINQKKLRFTWTSPLVFSPHDPRVLYFGSQYLLKTTDAGMSWQEISPDLTGAAPHSSASQQPVTLTNAKSQGYGVIYTIAPSPRDSNEIWVGTDTGLIHITRDGGKTWANVTPAGLPEWSKISLIEASPFDAATAYAAVDRHRLDDYAPYIYRTHDYGKTWQKLGEGISAPAFVRAVREDAKHKGLLFAATEMGVYFSIDDGDHWQSLQLNMPTVPVHDLTVHGDDLVIATHGRSFWILDDISPLRELSPEISKGSAFLFDPAPVMRVRSDVSHESPLPAEIPAGENPPSGALIDYYLSTPADEVTIEILDSNGELVRRFSTNQGTPPKQPDLRFTNDWIVPPQPPASTAGMHRFVWDMRFPGPPRFQPSFDSGAVHGRGVPEMPRGPLALPGTYRVRFTANHVTVERPLTLIMDPRVKISAADLRQQFTSERDIIMQIRKLYAAAEEAVGYREQLSSLRRRLQDKPALMIALENLDRHIGEVAGNPPTSMVDRTPNGSPHNLVRLQESLAHLLDVVDSADYAPTTQALDSLKQLTADATQQIASWEQTKQRDLPAFNKLLTENGVPALGAPATSQSPAR